MTATQAPKRVYLTQVEDFALIQWMHNRTPIWGEGPQAVFEEAKVQFPAMKNLNVDHVRTRLNAFVESLPKAEAPITEQGAAERIAKLERELVELRVALNALAVATGVGIKVDA